MFSFLEFVYVWYVFTPVEGLSSSFFDLSKAFVSSLSCFISCLCFSLFVVLVVELFPDEMFPCFYSLREKCPCLELFWSVFYRIWIEYGEILRISSYSGPMRENRDQNNPEYGHFWRSDFLLLVGLSELDRPCIFLFIFFFCPFSNDGGTGNFVSSSKQEKTTLPNTSLN